VSADTFRELLNKSADKLRRDFWDAVYFRTFGVTLGYERWLRQACGRYSAQRWPRATKRNP